MYGLITVSTFVGVGNALSDVRPTLAAVVAESTASVAAWMRAVPEDVVAEVADPGEVDAGEVDAGGAACAAGGVVAEWWSERTATATPTITRNRQAKTTVAVKT